jgi:endogenous inhibitor of DNA gyrase (YacG/DUF329 family)
MWSYAAEDTEADLARRYLSHARTAAAHSWAFVLAASSPEEYTHRETLMGDSFDKAVTAAVGDDVGYFLDTRVAMITELAEDFAVVQAQRAHEASLQAAAATKRAEAERRALQINAAFAELTKTASEVDEGVDDKNVTTTVPLQGGEDNSPTFMATRTAGAFDGPEDYGNDPYADKGDPFYVSYTCPKCGTTGSSRISDNSAGRPICHGCGNDIPADAITTGQRYLSSKSNVCPKCGTSVKATQDVDGYLSRLAVISQNVSTASLSNTNAITTLAVPAQPYVSRVYVRVLGQAGFSASTNQVVGLNVTVAGGTLYSAIGNQGIRCAEAARWYPFTWFGYIDLPASTATTITVTASISGGSNAYYRFELQADIRLSGQFA